MKVVRVNAKQIICPECGLTVHVAGKLVSYHAMTNGCRWGDGPWEG